MAAVVGGDHLGNPHDGAVATWFAITVDVTCPGLGLLDATRNVDPCDVGNSRGVCGHGLPGVRAPKQQEVLR